ncbi:single-stranded DNA-binding protein [Streptacidiphilus monticola]
MVAAVRPSSFAIPASPTGGGIQPLPKITRQPCPPGRAAEPRPQPGGEGSTVAGAGQPPRAPPQLSSLGGLLCPRRDPDRRRRQPGRQPRDTLHPRRRRHGPLHRRQHAAPFDKTTNQWKDSTALFLRRTAWRDLAEHSAETLAKGMRVIVTGRLVQHNWQTDQGENRSMLALDVNEVGPSLRFTTAKVTKTNRTSTPGAEADPWATASPAGGVRLPGPGGCHPGHGWQ